MKYLDILYKVSTWSRSKSHYLELNVPVEDGFFIVNCDQLTDSSHQKEKRKCDICGKDFEKTHQQHLASNAIFNKDVCPECFRTNSEILKIRNDRRSATCIERFGVSNPMQVKEIQEKLQQVLADKYGADNPMFVEEIKNRQQKTCQELYGGNSPFSSPDVRAKALESYTKNNTFPASAQQVEIKSILDNLYPDYTIEINYPLSRCVLDILLSYNDIKIDIEYDGWYWHKDKADEDRRRDEYLKTQGYKILRIKSRRLIPPTESLQDKIDKLLFTDYKYQEIILEDWDE